MANPDISAKAFLKELMDISLHIIWKDPYYANNAEPANTRIDAETYVAARNGELLFNSVFQFHESVLRMFIHDENLLQQVMLDKRKIPENLRDPITKAEAVYMINYWENQDGESNAYYRMLFGLPPIDTPESEFIYNTKYGDIDMKTPIHKLPYVERLKLENRGYLEELINDPKNHDKPYLKHLGKYRIYPYVSRQAEDFQLLFVQPSKFQYLRRDFITVYEQARRMVMRVYYTDAYRNQAHLYEGFLGLCILFITQQRMYAKYLEADISRDFYDLESLKLVYDAYGVPFYSSIPLKYHTRIIKRLNELISYKGSTQVFYDLFGLFDFGRMDAFEYYLVKERKTDDDGNPLFKDADGKPLDPKEMWNLRFAKVAWKDDRFVELTNPDNAVEYEDLTTVDPYWIEDEDLQKKLYETDWNYLNSKYMGVQIMFDLSQLMFETCYFLRMLQDNRSTLKDLTVYYIMTGEDIPIYDMVIYAVALLCKNAGYTGEIPTDPASVAAVYGFNFKQYNQLLKMATSTMNDFVLNFKTLCKKYATDNPILALDDTLFWMIDKITDGAFNYLGDDFPYDEWLYAPTPLFLKDFWPTRNSVESVKKYLRETIELLRSDPTLTEWEITQLYSRVVTHDNFEFVVTKDPSKGQAGYETFLVKSTDYNEEDLKILREAVIASYEEMLSWMIRLLDTRTALTIDPHVIEIINNMNIDSVDDIDRLYENMLELDEYLLYRLQNSTSRMETEAFINLRKILLTTGLMDETFTKRNGQVAKTYADLLEDVNPTLYQRLINEDLDFISEEQYAIQTLMKLSDDLELLESANTTNIKRIVEYLFKILTFLKSAKVDLTEFQIIYMITDRGMNFIKFIAELYEQHVTHLPYGINRDRFYLKDLDTPWWIVIVQYFLDRWELIEKNHGMHVDQVIASIFEKITDELEMYVDMYGTSEFEYIFDWLHSVAVAFHKKEELMLHEVSREELRARDIDSAFVNTHDVFYPAEPVVRKSLDHLNKLFAKVHLATIDYDIRSNAKLTDGISFEDLGDHPIYDATMLSDELIKISEELTP